MELDAEQRDALLGTWSVGGVAFQGSVIEDEHVKLACFSDPDGSGLYLCQVPHGGPSG